jgi:UDP-N-acetylglucosamine 1-carboxyvinyltransferase
MKQFLIRGGNRLTGTVKIAGAKNAASKMIIASLLTKEQVILHNVPLQEETDIAKELIEMIGATASIDDHTLTTATPEIRSTSTMALSRKNRLSILLAAPLMHRSGEATIPKVEGDKIGPRPVNYHVSALQRMGATVEVTD